MTYELPLDDAYEPYHASSPTDRVILELQMYGHRPHQDEPDARPLPDDEVIRAGLAGIVETFAGMLGDTRLEPDLDDLLWSFANVFHRAAERVARSLDRNEEAQRSSQQEQDGSEVKSVELERLTAEGITYIERRNVLEIMRDEAADLYEAQTGSAWRPRTGSKVSHQAITAAVIDSRDFLAARRRAETEVLVPAGTKIAFAGGLDCNDHDRIWDALDRARENIPTWSCSTAAARAAPSASQPAGPRTGRSPRSPSGSGITDNLADKARRLGIPVWRFAEGGA